MVRTTRATYSRTKKAGVVAAPAGNHAQGLALASNHLGVKALIVMPISTPSIKADSVRRMGARIILSGANSLSTVALQTHCCPNLHDPRTRLRRPRCHVKYGTIGAEVLRQLPTCIDAIFVPVGGGGLCAGICAFIKASAPGSKSDRRRIRRIGLP